MQRLRLRYAKRGPARFSSSRDFSRAFERALRRAEIPMAYSSGFSPHPRISYANAAPTGAATEAEYVEIGLAARCDPEAVRAALNEALPPGISIEQVAEAAGPALAERMEASRWRVRLQVASGDLASAVAALLEAPSVEVERMTKNGVRRFDARAAVVALDVVDAASFEVLLRQGTPLVRPDDVTRALSVVAPGFELASPPLLERLAQGPLHEGNLTDPLA